MPLEAHFANEFNSLATLGINCPCDIELCIDCTLEAQVKKMNFFRVNFFTPVNLLSSSHEPVPS